MTIKQKIAISFISLITVFGLSLGWIVQNNTVRIAEKSFEEKLLISSNLGLSLFESKYPGAWNIQNNELYKGKVKINGNFEVMDEIKKRTGILATVFMGDTRVATSVVKPDGSRAVGTKVVPEVANVVLNKGLNYSGEALVVGKKCWTLYCPILDSQGKVIGIWFVGVDKTNIDREIAIYMGTIIVAILVLLVLGILFAFWFSERILKRLPKMVDVLKKMAQGDFSNSINDSSKDEFGQLANELNKMNESLSPIIVKVMDVATRVGNGSREIASGNQDLSQRTQEQAATLEEVASTIEVMTATIQQCADNSNQADQISRQTLDAVHEGEKSVDETIEAMKRITESSKQVGEIIKVVNDIAFQTNLLALNAAIEAARAGEQGRGFAVVAAEVRNLAGRTAESSKEIVKLINESVERVERGNVLVRRSGEMLQQIVCNTKNTSDVVVEIAAALREQSVASEQMTSAISQLNQVTQQNAAMVEEIASSSEEVNAEVDELSETMSFFRIDRRKSFGPSSEVRSRRGDSRAGIVPIKENGQLASGFKEDDFERF